MTSRPGPPPTTSWPPRAGPSRAGIGHTGTLDPLATGVLALACGKATRLVRFLTPSDKDYEATLRFGLATDTYDITGPTHRRDGREADARGAWPRRWPSLTGERLQTPPAYSAKKVDGHRAYELARQATSRWRCRPAR